MSTRLTFCTGRRRPDWAFVLVDVHHWAILLVDVDGHVDVHLDWCFHHTLKQSYSIKKMKIFFADLILAIARASTAGQRTNSKFCFYFLGLNKISSFKISRSENSFQLKSSTKSLLISKTYWDLSKQVYVSKLKLLHVQTMRAKR